MGYRGCFEPNHLLRLEAVSFRLRGLKVFALLTFFSTSLQTSLSSVTLGTEVKQCKQLVHTSVVIAHKINPDAAPPTRHAIKTELLIFEG